MCGIALFYGNKAEGEAHNALAKLAHRGPDDRQIWLSDKLAIGFVRLAINDESSAGRQPYQALKLIGAFNCEIYNAKELIEKYNLKLISDSDAYVIAPLFEKLGNQVLHELNGFYSGIIYHTDTDSLFLLRDHIGKKPLFYGKANNQLFVVSELKAVQNIEWFEQVPLGICQLDLATGKLSQIAKHLSLAKPNISLFDAIRSAILVRLPKQAFGVFLSGGLDSAIVASIVAKYRQDVTYFVLGDIHSTDRQMANKVIAHLGLTDIEYVALPSVQILPSLIEEIVFATESFNPSIVSNGLATYLLAKAANKRGLKVVLTGEGSDELFGGYHKQLSNEEWQLIRTRLITDMRFTELRRLDSCTMAKSIEARCPFLDRAVKCIADNLEHTQFYSQGTNKVILRESFKDLLPDEVINRKKTSFDVGSGIRQLVVNYLTQKSNTEIKELKGIWEKHFSFDATDPYFFSYPIFDSAIAKRGIQHR